MIKEEDFETPLPNVDPVSFFFISVVPSVLESKSFPERGPSTLATDVNKRQFTLPSCSWACNERLLCNFTAR